MKKMMILSVVALLAVACGKSDDKPTLPLNWYGEYSTVSVGQLKLVSTGLIPENTYDIDETGTLRIDSIGPNRVKLTEQDSITREGTISGNKLDIDELDVDTTIMMMKINGSQKGEGVLVNGVLTIQEKISGLYNGVFTMGGVPVPVSGVISGGWTTTATKK